MALLLYLMTEAAEVTMGASTVEAVSVAHLEKPPKINDENIRRRCNVDFFIAAKHLKCQAQSSFILKMGWIHENSIHTKSRKTKRIELSNFKGCL